MSDDVGNSSDQSYFKFHRYWIEDSPVFANPELLQIFLWLLNRARHKPGHLPLKSGQVVSLKAGEGIVGREAAARELGMSPSTFRNRLGKLKDMGVVKLDTKDKSFTRFSIVFPSGLKPRKDKARTALGQGEDSPRTALGQGEDTNKTNETDQKNEKNKKNNTNERESSGDAAFPPTHDKILSLIEEYIKTSSIDEKTSELSQEIESLKTQAEEIKSHYQSLLAAGSVKKETKEWSDAVDKYNQMLADAKSKQMFLDLSMVKNELGEVRKQDLARELFNYWEGYGWKKNGRRINLISEVNKWTQREISKKHEGKAGHGRSRLTAAEQLRNQIYESNLQDRRKTEVPAHRIF